MNYQNMVKGTFIDRPNRFIAHVEIAGAIETVHVKNTGRCRELLQPGAVVYLAVCDNPDRKTKWDLIAVWKGTRLINVDSQVPNCAAKEWIESGNLFSEPVRVKREVRYGDSRIDLYAESPERRAFIEVKGVTLEEDGVVRFPDAPSERAIKHVHELCRAVKEGYEAYLLFVIQMSSVSYFTPNCDTQPAFCDALLLARECGVHILAWDCIVTPDSIALHREVPVRLSPPALYETPPLLLEWYQKSRRDLPWRTHLSAYHTWLSEIMLQQTRVEAVKPYYARFLAALPTVQDLATVPEDRLLKLWEGLGYYNRVRNMQRAARYITVDLHGQFPSSYEEILQLPGIGTYTAGAIASIAFGIPRPAVDGNVLRVLTRFLGDDSDILEASTKKKMEMLLQDVIPSDQPGDFNQALIELGALVCVPNAAPHCKDCPLSTHCTACALSLTEVLPVRRKPKKRKVERRTVLIFKDGENLAIKKRPAKGLLAGLYELPNVTGHLTKKEALSLCRELGLSPLHIQPLQKAKHIFSHVEWQMCGYEIRVDELAKSCDQDMLFIHPDEIKSSYPIPAAFEAYFPHISIES